MDSNADHIHTIDDDDKEVPYISSPDDANASNGLSCDQNDRQIQDNKTDEPIECQTSASDDAIDHKTQTTDKTIDGNDGQIDDDMDDKTKPVSTNPSRHQYSKEELIAISKLCAARIRPQCLDSAFNSPDGLWNPEKWMSFRSPVPLTSTTKHNYGKREGNEAFPKKPINNDLKDKMDDVDIVLSPQRNSFGTGCHVVPKPPVIEPKNREYSNDRNKSDEPRDAYRDGGRRQVGTGRVNPKNDRLGDWYGSGDKGYDRGDKGYDRGDKGYDRGDKGYDRGFDRDRANSTRDRENGFRYNKDNNRMDDYPNDNRNRNRYQNNGRNDMQNRGYNRNQYRNHYEEEKPEWFTDEEPMTFMNLTGFDDDDRGRTNEHKQPAPRDTKPQATKESTIAAKRESLEPKPKTATPEAKTNEPKTGGEEFDVNALFKTDDWFGNNGYQTPQSRDSLTDGISYKADNERDSKEEKSRFGRWVQSNQSGSAHHMPHSDHITAATHQLQKPMDPTKMVSVSDIEGHLKQQMNVRQNEEMDERHAFNKLFEQLSKKSAQKPMGAPAAAKSDSMFPTHNQHIVVPQSHHQLANAPTILELINEEEKKTAFELQQRFRRTQHEPQHYPSKGMPTPQHLMKTSQPPPNAMNAGPMADWHMNTIPNRNANPMMNSMARHQMNEMSSSSPMHVMKGSPVAHMESKVMPQMARSVINQTPNAIHATNDSRNHNIFHLLKGSAHSPNDHHMTTTATHHQKPLDPTKVVNVSDIEGNLKQMDIRNMGDNDERQAFDKLLFELTKKSTQRPEQSFHKSADPPLYQTNSRQMVVPKAHQQVLSQQFINELMAKEESSPMATKRAQNEFITYSPNMMPMMKNSQTPNAPMNAGPPTAHDWHPNMNTIPNRNPTSQEMSDNTLYLFQSALLKRQQLDQQQQHHQQQQQQQQHHHQQQQQHLQQNLMAQQLMNDSIRTNTPPARGGAGVSSSSTANFLTPTSVMRKMHSDRDRDLVYKTTSTPNDMSSGVESMPNSSQHQKFLNEHLLAKQQMPSMRAIIKSNNPMATTRQPQSPQLESMAFGANSAADSVIGNY